ncbi:L-rhamnose mutarotase [Niabella soli]|uniref:L-rhamnose mutarotase n=1 Tax=Niabella soli DSM 19437 TaxID=929713 RepID=W0F136_9BACT|nr:L-rhamnose mutarotase [Niabella soli]AHF16702.1 hypothetical protein NIASO_19025 [Niabella soli DSM 19437]
MKRFCLTLDLKNDPELIKTYEHYHSRQAIWPEVIEGIKACGIYSMDIYRADTRLAMILEAQDDFELDAGFAKMSELPRQKEWAALMNRFQQKPPFAKPGEHWVPMQQIFELYGE